MKKTKIIMENYKSLLVYWNVHKLILLLFTLFIVQFKPKKRVILSAIFAGKFKNLQLKSLKIQYLLSYLLKLIATTILTELDVKFMS